MYYYISYIYAIYRHSKYTLCHIHTHAHAHMHTQKSTIQRRWIQCYENRWKREGHACANIIQFVKNLLLCKNVVRAFRCEGENVVYVFENSMRRKKKLFIVVVVQQNSVCNFFSHSIYSLLVISFLAANMNVSIHPILFGDLSTQINGKSNQKY